MPVNSIAFWFCRYRNSKKGTYRMAKLFLFSVSSTSTSSSFYVYKGPCSKCSLITWCVCVCVWRWWWWCVCIARTQTISIFLAFIFPSDIFHCSHWHRYAIVFVCISTHRETERESARESHMFMYFTPQPSDSSNFVWKCLFDVARETE